MALKLPAFKAGGLKKKSADQPWPHSNQSAQIRVRQGVKSSTKFDGLQLCTPLTYKDLFRKIYISLIAYPQLKGLVRRLR